MSAYAMKPNFTTRQEYLSWKKSWKTIYSRLSDQIRRRKLAVKEAQRAGSSDARRMQKELRYIRSDANKLMLLLGEAKIRRDRILQMQRDLAEQNASFPLVLGDCKNIDFFFNKGSLEWTFLPQWVVKAKGKSFYVNDLSSAVGFSTRNLATGSTRGMLRFKRAKLRIDQQGVAHLEG